MNELRTGELIEDRFEGDYYRIMVVANKFQTGFDQPLLAGMFLDKPVRELTKEQLEIVLYGTGEKQIQMTYQGANGNEFKFSRAFEGIITNLERRYKETNSEYIREKISEFMSDRPCPSCGGKRLNPSALAVTVDDVNISKSPPGRC